MNCMNGFCRTRGIVIHRKGVKTFFQIWVLIFISFSVLSASGTNAGGNSLSLHGDVLPTARADKDTSQVKESLRLLRTLRYSDLSLAERHADNAIALAEKIQYAQGLIEGYLGKGDILRIRGNFAESERFTRSAISLCERENDEIGLAKGHLGMFWLFSSQGNYQKAEGFNEKARELAEKYANQEILAEVYGNLAVVAGMKGQHVRSIEYFLRALEIFRTLNDELQVGMILGRMGHTFELAGSYDKSLDYLFQALEIHKRNNNLYFAGWCLLNIGVAHSRIQPHNYELKRGFYQQALEMAEKTGDFRLKLACLDNIGGSYSLEGDFEKAGFYLMRAYRLSTSAGRNSRTVFIAGNLAENFLYAGQLDSALMFARENLRIAIEEENTFEKRQAYSVLSQIHAARREDRQAYEMLLRHKHLSDSIFNVEKSQQIEGLREAYEAEKKEQKITLLTKEKGAAEFRRNSFAVLAMLFLTVGLLVAAILRLRMKRNQLLLQKEMELDRMKSRFFANISHEFRTPLTLILGPIDDMISRTDDPRTLRHLKPMRRNAARLLDLVNQLLELSKIESGKLKLVLSRRNVVTLIKGVAMSFDSLAEMKHVSLEVSSDDDVIEMYADWDKIEKILGNLLSNAFKFTSENGSISVRIQSRVQSPANGRYLQVSVHDSGTGIPQAEVGHIFDRFYQADNNQLHQQDGSGIGLALTKELVELHRGTIWAHSNDRTGTTIHFQIPLNLEVLMPEYVAEEPAPVSVVPVKIIRDVCVRDFPDSGETDPVTEKPLVLLVEDHVDVRKYIREILTDAFTVLEAADGEEGIALALDRIPDLIVCDVMMPRKNGHEVCTTLKQQERTSHIPLILLTAKADIDSRIEGLETKADDYLTKPFVPKELLLRISNLIDSRQQLREKYLQTMILKPAEVAITSVDEKFLKRLMDLLEQHIGDEKFGVEALGEEIGMSRSQLHRKLKALIGQGPNQFIRTFRLNRAHDMLKAQAATAAEIAYAVGFSSPSYFTKCFHEQFGYTPSDIAGQYAS